jgi:hypothetical protein
MSVRDYIARQLHEPDEERGAPVGVSDQYIVLDSAEKVEGASDPARGVFSFNFMTQGVTHDEHIGVRDDVDRVIEVGVAPFYTGQRSAYERITNDPATDDATLPTLTANGAAPATTVLGPFSQLPYGGRILMYLSEIGLQSYSDCGGVRHHFELQATTAGSSLLLTPLNDFETYVFTDPITMVHGVTVRFTSPYTPVAFPPDVLYGAVPAASGGGLLQFTSAAHGLAADDRVYVRNFTSTSVAINAWVNRVDGHVVGTNGLTANVFRLNPDVDVSALAAPISSTRVNVIVAHRRIRIPLRMRRLLRRRTNYKAP